MSNADMCLSYDTYIQQGYSEREALKATASDWNVYVSTVKAAVTQRNN